MYTMGLLFLLSLSHSLAYSLNCSNFSNKKEERTVLYGQQNERSSFFLLLNLFFFLLKQNLLLLEPALKEEVNIITDLPLNELSLTLYV